MAQCLLSADSLVGGWRRGAETVQQKPVPGAASGRGSFMPGELEHSHFHLYVASLRQAVILSQQGMRTEGVNRTQDQHRARYMKSQKCRRAESLMGKPP